MNIAPKARALCYGRRTHRSPLRLALLAFFAISFAFGVIAPALAQPREREAIVAEVDGAINPVTKRFIERVVKKGESDNVELVIFQLDTPGGLLSSTEKIVEALLRDKVPTVVYVSPRGAFAASAGTFITAAANFAVMAPGTSIGAASPVSGGGEDLPDTLERKVTEAVVALITSVAEVRGRNAEALEATVRNAEAYSAEEAERLKVVDFIATDLDDLLRQLHGRSVPTVDGPRVLNTQDLKIRSINMTLIERFLFFLADPNVSFILLSIGGLGLVIELFNPGLIIPVVVGIICLVLFFLSAGSLPVNWAGVALILFAMILLFAEIFVAGFGVLGIGAIVSFILGGLILFSGSELPDSPSTKVSLWALVPFTTIVFGGGGYLMYTIIQSRKPGSVRTTSSMIGMVGLATTELAPQGMVRLQDELWTGVAEGTDPIPAGDHVRVLSVNGVVLSVVRTEEELSPGQLPL